MAEERGGRKEGEEGRPWGRDVLRCVCMSDTHGKHRRLEQHHGGGDGSTFPPPGDVLVHTGDYSNTGEAERSLEFFDWFGTVGGEAAYKHRVLIAGNHDLTADVPMYTGEGSEAVREMYHGHGEGEDWRAVRRVLEAAMPAAQLETGQRTNFTYLEDQGVRICADGTLLPYEHDQDQDQDQEAGDGTRSINVWGSPVTPTFHVWAFMLDRGEPLMRQWQKIPSDVDMLLTHGPPWGVRDYTAFGARAGCEALRDELLSGRIAPRCHIFGHIHETYGVTCDASNDNGTLFVNPSSCTLKYRCTNAPIVFDLPLDRTSPARLVSGEPFERVSILPQEGTDDDEADLDDDGSPRCKTS